MCFKLEKKFRQFNSSESENKWIAEGMNILKEWKKVDLTSLGKVKKIVFTMSSTDSGQWGINTPTYFCLDQLKVTE